MTESASQASIEETWHEYFALKHPSIREKIALHYMIRAKRVAASLSKTLLPSICPIEDLEGLSMLILMKSIDTFDHHRIKNQSIDDGFCGYLSAKIHHKIIEFYRKESWGSRGQVTVSKSVKTFKDSYFKEHGFYPHISEIMEHVAQKNNNHSDRYVEMAINACESSRQVYDFDRCFLPDFDELSQRDILDRALIQNEFGLDKRDLEIAQMTYLDGKTKEDISRITGIPEGTIGHCRVRSIRTIRGKMQKAKRNMWNES